ncbi:MAG: viperin family antiviral radical SAM protein [Candidatus Methanomethylophilaceae archaeon]|nr:viperin family antiviral radical SAM protein [Candidatus Methanomethylophilaceae archaeon]
MNSESVPCRKFRSANIHVYGRCNYRCEHCFDRCLTKNYMRPDDWADVLSFLKGCGVEKINLAGGEPLMYPFLDQMCYLIKGMGFKLSIVSNGSLITDDWLSRMEGVVDWIGLSIDSVDEEDEMLIGRGSGGHLDNVAEVARMAREHGIRVKLNITVVRRSWMKDFGPLTERIRPDRVKCFRALTLRNANDDVPDTWSVTNEQFADFRRRHEGIGNILFEDNEDMVASYVMFDPMGRWMVNTGYEKRFISFEVVRREGLGSEVDIERYYSRNAVYDW